jgi:uncharacterized protein (DUF2141 family)
MIVDRGVSRDGRGTAEPPVFDDADIKLTA